LHHDPSPILDPAPERWRLPEAEFRSIWAGLTLPNDRIRAAMPITFRPLDHSTRECVESLLAIAHVTPTAVSTERQSQGELPRWGRVRESWGATLMPPRRRTGDHRKLRA
jgi:hypothetical protein